MKSLLLGGLVIAALAHTASADPQPANDPKSPTGATTDAKKADPKVEAKAAADKAKADHAADAAKEKADRAAEAKKAK